MAHEMCRHIRRAGRLAPTLLSACLLALAGCAPLLPGSTRPLIKIGLAAPFEGLGRPLGYEALHGVKLALAHCNAAGGVGGYMVELVALNDTNEPDEARLQAGEFAADPAVMGVVTGWDDHVARAALPAYREAGLGVVVPWSIPPDQADPEVGVVLIAADTWRVAEALAETISTAPPQRVVVVGDEQSVAPYVAALGPLVQAVPLPDTPDDDSYQDWAVWLVLSRVRPPDVVILAADGAQAGRALMALTQLNWQGTAYGNADTGSVHLVDVAGPAAEGMIFASPSPAGRDIPHDIGLTAGLPLDELGPRAVLAYDATQVLLKAIEATIQEEGEPSRQGVIAALPSVRVEGLTGDIATNPSGNRADAPVWLYRIVNNEYPGRRGKLIGHGPG